jgi:uncharacterized membrane protein
MKHIGVSVATIILLTFLLCSALTFDVEAQGTYTTQTTTIKVYRDGLTHITQTLTVDELQSSVSIPLLSVSIENLIVLDKNNLTVDYVLNSTTLTVFSLGADQIVVEYDTAVLTNKQAEVWTIQLNNSYDVKLILPFNSTIVYLNQVPTLIDTTGGELSLSIGPNQWEISYIVPFQDDIQDDEGSIVPFPIGYLIVSVIIVVVAIVIVAWLLMRKRKINVKKTLSKNPTLSNEDKAVIEFLAEKDGKAFEAEIRQRFPDMPRTSLWRLVRRLEGLDIVEIKRIGLENQVILIKK